MARKVVLRRARLARERDDKRLAWKAGVRVEL